MLGGFDSKNYKTEREWAAASDGAKVPISIVYRKDAVKLDGSAPMLLEAYGSYGIPNDPRLAFALFLLPLVKDPYVCLD